MSILESNILDKIEEGTKEEALAAAQSAGKEYTPLWFDYRDKDWECALHYIKFCEGEKGAFPEITLEKWFPDFSEPRREIHERGRENPIFAPTEEGDEALDEIKDAFQTSCMEAFDAEKPVKDLISSIRETLQVFIPLLPDEETIPQQRFSGCDIESEEWKTLAKWARENVIHWKRENPENLLQELAENASYGGQPGLVVSLDGKDILQWMECQDLYEVITSQGESNKTSLAVYDFVNGSGHDLEGITVRWKNVPRTQGSQPGIINNFIESVFGLVGNSRISIPGKGCGCWDNLWLPKNP